MAEQKFSISTYEPKAKYATATSKYQQEHSVLCMLH